VSDFRSNPMPSPDGMSIAKDAFKKAWSIYAKALEPVTSRVASPIGQAVTFDMYGFWITWHLLGGFEGLQKSPQEGGLGMSRSAVYRRIQMFRKATGKHPDEFTLPGVSINVQEFLQFLAKSDTPKK
jgi:hypothetical protein